MWYVHTTEHHSDIKKNNATCSNTDGPIVTLSEVRAEVSYLFYVESKKTGYKWSYLQNRLKDFEEFMVAGGRMVGRDSYGVSDGNVHTAIFKMDNQKGPTV